MNLFNAAINLPFSDSASFLSSMQDAEAIDFFFAKQILSEMSGSSAKLNVNEVIASQLGVKVELSFYLLVALSYEQRKGSLCLQLTKIAEKTLWDAKSLKAEAYLGAISLAKEQIDAHENAPNEIDLQEKASGYTFPNIGELIKISEILVTCCAHDTYLHYQDGNLYSRRYYIYEQQFCDFVKSRINTTTAQGLVEKRRQQSKQVQNLLSVLFDNPITDGINIDLQQIATINSLCHYFSIITGGAGTGKTYTITRLLLALSVLDNISPENIALLAPTGKAANRLKQSLFDELEKLPEHPLINETKDSFYSIRPQTIHNLLKIDPIRGQTKYSALNPLALDLVIIDESSMVDISLMDKIIGAIDSQTTLILIGDANQLPSVETGSLLADLVAIPAGSLSFQRFNQLCKIVPELKNIGEQPLVQLALLQTENTMALASSKTTNKDAVSDEPHNAQLVSNSAIATKSHAAAEAGNTATGWVSRLTSGKRSHASINQLAHAILRADYNAIKACYRLPQISYFDYSFNQPSSFGYSSGKTAFSYELLSPDLRERLLGCFSELMQAQSPNAAFKALSRFSLLTPFRRGKWGVDSLNIAIEDLLAQQHDQVIVQGFYPGKPIIVLANDYQLGLFNGDVGIVWPDDSGQLKAYFVKPTTILKSKVADKILDQAIQDFAIFPLYSLPKFETTYATTIHKTQGSEYDHVELIIPESENDFLNRQLIYTGATRAKNSIGIWSNARTLKQAIARDVDRVSGVNTRIR